MIGRIVAAVSLLAVFLAVHSGTEACSLCGAGKGADGETFRKDVAHAKVVVYGTLTQSRITADGGNSVLQVDRVLKTDPYLDGKKNLTLPKYLPIDKSKDLPRYLIFGDVYKDAKTKQDKLDPYRGVEVKSADLADYLTGAMSLDPKDSSKALLYFSRYLDHATKDVAADAFLEFARATDQEIAAVAKSLNAERIRKLVQDPQTPGGRLSLFAYLLGSCGKESDVDILKKIIEKPDERTMGGIAGALPGYIALKPREGWDLGRAVLVDPKRSLHDRLAILDGIRFLHGSKIKDTEKEILACLKAAIEQGELGDLAIEDLRKWQNWELTGTILTQFGTKPYESEIMKRSIIRYALTCTKPEAGKFLEEVRKKNPDVVKFVEESLEYERKGQ